MILMKVLVTGGTGFIGSHLIQKLVQTETVYSLERYSTGRYVLGKKYNVRKVYGDLRDSFAVREIVRRVQPEVVFHLAAISAVSYSFEHPQEVGEVNYLGTVNLAEACLRHVPHFKQLIFAGSAEEYGDQETFPIKEDAPLKPLSPYAVAKVAANRYLDYMVKAYNFPATILRGFNCYDEETQVLTNKGFKYFKDLGGNELIASLNPKTECLEYQKPIDFVAKPYEGNMIKVKGRQLDLLVTPNHNMWVRKYNGGKYHLVEAYRLLDYKGKPKGPVFLLSPPYWNGKQTSYYNIPKFSKKSLDLGKRLFIKQRLMLLLFNIGEKWFTLDEISKKLEDFTGLITNKMLIRSYLYIFYRKGFLERKEKQIYRGKHQLYKVNKKELKRALIWSIPIEVWVKFLAWYLSEGSINKNEVKIKQKSLKRAKEVLRIIKALGVKAHFGREKSGIYHSRFSDRGFAYYLKQFGHAKAKFIPDFIKQLPRGMIKEFLKTYEKGDGHIGYFHGYKACESISSYSSSMIDDLQELCLKAGWASSSNGRWLFIARKRNEVHPSTKNNFSIKDYSGMVYCVTVPNHIIYVRRHGKGMFCGNTYGRKRNPHFFIERTVTQILNGDQVKLGDPTAIRDWLYIDDHVNGYLKAFQNIDKAVGGTFNLATGKGFSTKETVDLIAEIARFKGRIVWHTIPDRPSDIHKLVGDSSRANNTIGWNADVSLEEGLMKTISYWKKKGV